MLVLAPLLMVLGGGVALIVLESLVTKPPQRLRLDNFRGNPIPAVGGIVLLASLLSAETALSLIGLFRPGTLSGSDAISPSALAVTFGSVDHLALLLVAVGFFALGTLDDLGGAERARGFAGHARALRHGALTGGVIKAVGGGALAFVAAAFWNLSLGPALVDAALVALTANLLNLLDLRPGRAVKVFLIGWVPIVGFGWADPYFPVSSAVASASIVWLPADLGERGMLGDGGANLLGAVLGAGVAITAPLAGRLIVLLVLAVLTAVSELWSFSSIIEAVSPLRWFDRLGRQPE